MTDGKSARVWLELIISSPDTSDSTKREARTLKRALAEPRIPERASDAALAAMDHSAPGEAQYARDISIAMYGALHAHLCAAGDHTPPADLDAAAAAAQEVLFPSSGQPTLFVVRDAVIAALKVLGLEMEVST